MCNLIAFLEVVVMRKHIMTVNKAMLKKTLRSGGCGECPHHRSFAPPGRSGGAWRGEADPPPSCEANRECGTRRVSFLARRSPFGSYGFQTVQRWTIKRLMINSLTIIALFRHLSRGKPVNFPWKGYGVWAFLTNRGCRAIMEKKIGFLKDFAPRLRYIW